MIEAKNIFFLGIGGIGMSALARYFYRRGAVVWGYDRVESDITRSLQAEGMGVFYDDDPLLLPAGIELVIYTPAIPVSSRCMAHLAAMGLPLRKRAEVLGMICRKAPTIAVAGTHGKTTVCCMLAHIMVQAGLPVEAILGGVATNYNSNYIGCDDPAWMVVEADEYDRSFLHLRPAIALITAIDADHLDIYGTDEKMKESFHAFVNNIDPRGTLLLRAGLDRPPFAGLTLTYGGGGASDNHVGSYGGGGASDDHVGNYGGGGASDDHVGSYGGGDVADYHVASYHVAGGHARVSFAGRLELPETVLGLPGRHNMENALAAAALASLAGVSPGAIGKGLESFLGVKRRFELCFQSTGMVYIDDYAHHPAEIAACIGAARELYPGKSICGVFQPHLYSRTRDLAAGFARSLALLDELIMLDIYPAREEPIEGITAAWLMESIAIPRKRMASKETLLPLLDRLEADVLITMGAGDIDRLAAPIINLLKEKYR